MSKNTVPDFKSREEEAEYFDTHFMEEWEQGEPVRIRRAYDHPMQVRLDEELDRELQRFADAQGLKKSTLARMWLEQRVRQEREQRVP
jgi:hypothetical protein